MGGYGVYGPAHNNHQCSDQNSLLRVVVSTVQPAGNPWALMWVLNDTGWKERAGEDLGGMKCGYWLWLGVWDEPREDYAGGVVGCSWGNGV